ncbi:MAG: T9SS type A sorting domain-containing protein [Bacteroidota bacterium]
MKARLITLLIFIALNTYAIVDFSATYVIPHTYGPSCNNQQYVEVGFFTNFETNNDHFQIQRTKDPSWSWAITNTAQFNGNINGCGTCGSKQYTILDYGPFAPGEVWYYRVKATSNWMVYTYKDLGTYINNIPTIVNWINQVTSSVTVGNSPNTESSYSWSQETREMHGATINLIPTEVSKIYLEQNNNKISFNLNPISTFINLDINIDNQGYFNLYNGSSNTSFVWQNSASYFSGIGTHNLKVKYTIPSGTIYLREYEVYVVPKSDAFYRDNYCNTMRVWKGSDPVNGIPIILSEGFDAYNTKPEQYYREAGKNLFDCLLNKGFNIYVVNYNLNSQSIRNNAAVFRSAIRYVSTINNKLVIAVGISMGGIINRYACTKAENDGNPLPISKFLTLDAPHQGAVISNSLQDWRKHVVQGDVFSEHASNNDAAKELLNYNAYDPGSAIHTAFFNELNNLNINGYPHNVPTIGVSFSTSTPNPNSGEWLYVHVTGVPGNQNQHFYLTPNELIAGSFLPSVNIDPVPVSDPDYWLLLNTIRPFANPTATIIQYLNPTFIPYNSSLDKVNGVSKFNITIQPGATGYHDIIPADIIEPIINVLIKEGLYLQNKTISDTKNYIASNKIETGYNVTSTIPAGNFVLNNTSIVTMKAGKSISLAPGFIAQTGSNFIAMISPVSCDGTTALQERSVVQENSYENENGNSANTETIVVTDAVYNETTTSTITRSKTNELKIYPNPTNSSIIIETEMIPNKINIYNNLGLIVKELSDFESASTKIDFSSYPQGIYFVKIETQYGIKLEKVIYHH